MTEPNTHPVDMHVGSRIRMRRKYLGKSQQDLAEALGLTFQQVQKYERGANRISASTLHKTAKALHVPIAYFFDGYAGNTESDELSSPEGNINEFLLTREGLELAQNFSRIATHRARRSVLELVRTLGSV